MGGRRRRNSPAAKREIEPRASDVDAEAPEIGDVAQDGPATVADQRVGRPGADARHADQELARRLHDLEREVLGMGERPGRLGSWSSGRLPSAPNASSSTPKPYWRSRCS